MMEDSTAERSDTPPKFNIPTQMDYAKGCEFTPLGGSQVFHEVVTDTYVTASGNEDEMVERMDAALTALKGKVHGFAGYLSFHYLQMTLFYVMHEYDMCLKAIDNIMKGVEAVEKFVFTRSFDGVEANGVAFTNYAFGEDDAELKQTVKYLHDAWNFAKMLHAKASSFESGFSLLVAELMLHGYNKQLGMMKGDCDAFRDLLGHLRAFIEGERQSDVTSAKGMEFVNIEDLKVESTSTSSD